MDRVSVNPGKVRCLGNIVSPKTVSDFNELLANVSSGSDTVNNQSMTVYTSEYKVGSSLTVDYPRLVSADDTSFTVTTTLLDNSSSAISSATVYLSVNDTVTSSTTDSNGEVSFTVTCDGSSDYRLKCYYLGTSSLSGSVCFGRVYVRDADDLELFGDAGAVQIDGTAHLVARLTDEGVGVPGKTVLFFVEGGSAPSPLAPSSVSLSATSTSLTVGDNLSLSGTVSLDSTGTSGLSVKIYNGSTLVDTVTSTTGGAFSKTVSGLSVGSYSFKAVYEGDSTHDSSQSSTLNVTVSKITSTISLNGSNITYGNNVSLSGTLSVGSGKSVKIYQGTTLLDTVTTTTNGAFSKTVSGLGAGSYTFKASYEGDSTHTDVEATKSITVSKATPTITVTSTNTHITVNDTLALTGTLSAGSGKTVKIKQGSTVFNTVTTTTGGAYAANVTGLSVGQQYLTAVFEGDSNYNSASEDIIVYVTSGTPTPASIVLTSGKGILSYYDSESTNLIAYVDDADNISVEGATVEFFKGTTSLGTATTDSDGAARLSYSATGAGDVSFTAKVGSLVSETYSIEDCYNYLLTEGTITNSSGTKISGIGLNEIYNVQNSNFKLEFDGYGNGTLNIGAKNQWTSSTANYRLTIGYADGKNYWSVRTTSTSEGYGSTASTSTWYQYRIEREGTTIRFYVDDTLIQTKTGTSFLSNYSTWCIYSIIWGSATQKYKNIKLKPL